MSPEQAMALFRWSVLKQQKWHALADALGSTEGLRCLDIGSDNGVISYLFRQRGGAWTSADLDAETVAAIRALVRSDVVQLDGGCLPFSDGAFDRVVLVDCLEHVEDDQAFVQELVRITKPGGEVLFNVPLRKDSWLRRLRVALGQTDEAHGHVRPGYTLQELKVLWGTSFEAVAHRTYSKFFSEAVDTAMTWAIRRVKRSSAGGTIKGTMVTGTDLARHGTLLYLYTGFYPLLWAVAQLDRLLWFRSGYMLLAKVRRRRISVPATG